MTMKELAELLGVSISMVSRLAKRGMPTDSLERAQRWRKRHLEPGRVKGSRYDPTRKAEPAAPGPGPTQAASRDRSAPAAVPVEAAERLVMDTAAVLAANDQDEVAGMVAHLRELLRSLPAGTGARMPLRVWLALVDYALADGAAVRQSQDLDAILSPQEFARRVRPDLAELRGEWLDIACHWRGHSVTGLPACLDEK